MTCARALCTKDLSGPLCTPSRRDSIVFGLTFCSDLCMGREAAVRKQRLRRERRVDHQRRWERDLLKKYGITVEFWQKMYTDQNGLCAICGDDLETVSKVCTDHDHRTGAVRGLLCTECNHGLGKFKDRPEILMRAAEYLLGAATAADQKEVTR